MKKYLNYLSKGYNLVLSFFNLVLFFSIRMCWSGISKTLGYEDSYSAFILWLPVIIWFVLILIFIGNVLFFILRRDKNKWSYIMNGVNSLFLIVNIVIIVLGAIDYMFFAWPYVFKYFGMALVGLVIIFFIFIYPKTKLKDCNAFKYSCLGLITLISAGYVCKVNFNSVEYKPAVYIVEDDYQIVFGSKVDALAWVTIDDKRYYEEYAGYYKSTNKMHKIVVPMEVLDNAKEYTIGTQKLTYRGPFGGFKGREIEETYSFRPIDTSDGLNYYSISDVHMGLECSVAATDYNKDKELLILAGDTISMVDSYRDAAYTNKVAYEMTKGEIPVIYARGNHELKGNYMESFHEYVGAKGEDFFYTFSFGNVYGLVLDIGEDHDDEYWEYYDTCDFSEYRNEQLELVRKEIESKEYLNYEYRLVVCHIPLPFINTRLNHYDFKKEITTLLNQMDIDMVISGHQHDLLVFEPGLIDPYEDLKYNTDFVKSGKTTKAQLTDFNFPSFTVSKRGYTQTDDSSLTLNTQIGLSIFVDFNSKTQKCIFNNSKGEKVSVVNPYDPSDASVNLSYGDEIIYSIETNKIVR